jgi:hypothetical protein
VSRPTRETPAGRAYLYGVERWLARLSRSPYLNDFVLKGEMLLAAFGSRRPTVDADALARSMNADQETVLQRVTEIANRRPGRWCGVPDQHGGHCGHP